MQSTLPRPEAVLSSLRRVGQREKLDPLVEHLEALRRWLGDDLVSLEEALGRVIERDTNVAERAGLHLLERSGKRLRPICVLISARMGNGAPAGAARDAAVACELVHAATLLHDDVIDEGDKRRGAVAARIAYGNSASILAGDHLLVRALQLIQGLDRPILLQRMLEVIAQMVAAEALQLERRGRFEPSREDYLRIIEGKTAALFRWGLWAGGALAEAPASEVVALGAAGRELGMAFQLVDDVIDLSDAGTTGKSSFTDVLEGKLTWPLLVAAERDPEVLASLDAAARGELGAPGIAELVARVVDTGAVDETRRFATACGERARLELAALPPSPARKLLERVVDATVQRMR